MIDIEHSTLASNQVKIILDKYNLKEIDAYIKLEAGTIFVDGHLTERELIALANIARWHFEDIHLVKLEELVKTLDKSE